MSYFKDTVVNILNNNKLREPQIDAYVAIQSYFGENPDGEALVVLPTGTGKSGLISIAPFGVSNNLDSRINITRLHSLAPEHPYLHRSWIVSLRFHQQ